MAMILSFVFPTVRENPSGWGPCDPPEQFKDVPYQPFSKSDRVGKVADWSGSMYQDRRAANKYSNTYGQGGQQYAYHHEEDESSFQLVDTTKLHKTIGPHRRPKYSQQKIRRDREKREERRMGGKQQIAKGKLKERDRWRQQQHKRIKKFMRLGAHFDKNQSAPAKPRAPSVHVKVDWPVVNEIDFIQLAKLNLKPGEPQELRLCGSLGCYDISKEKRISLKTPIPLKKFNRIFHKVTTTDDPIIRELVKSPDCSDVKVFATDAILACLMTCARSKYSWDVVATRIGGHLFFDKRDDSQFDLLSVSETAKDPPQDDGEGADKNTLNSLAIEATYINQNYSQQMLLEGPGKTVKLSEPNPFAGDESEQVASVGYRYLKWQLGDGVGLVARCEYDAVMSHRDQKKVFINVKALNEWDPKKCGGVEWNKKLESQKGAVFATELKNNSCKIAKWALSSLLAGSSFIKFGYVARVRPTDPTSHRIVGIQTVKPTELAQQTSLDVGNAWGVLRAIIDACFQMDYDTSKKILILKDPNQAVIRLYQIPMETFEESEDESSSSGVGEGSDEERN